MILVRLIPVVLIAGCAVQDNSKNEALINSAWSLESEYQKATREILEKDLQAIAFQKGSENCVLITAKPNNDIMGGDSMYCFDPNGKLVLADRPTN